MRHYLIALCVVLGLALFADGVATGPTIPRVYLPIIGEGDRTLREIVIRGIDVPASWVVVNDHQDPPEEYGPPVAYIVSYSTPASEPTLQVFSSTVYKYASPDEAQFDLHFNLGLLYQKGARVIDVLTVGDESYRLYTDEDQDNQVEMRAFVGNLLLYIATTFSESSTYELAYTCGKLMAQRAGANEQGSCDLSPYDGTPSANE